MLPFLAAVLTFVAAAVGSALAVLLTGGGRGLNLSIAAGSLAVGLLAGIGAFVHARTLPANRRPAARLSPWAWLVFAAFALFALRSFCWLVFEDNAHDGYKPRLMIGNANNLGDISLHMQFARDFANGVHWWPEHPEVNGITLRYYPGVDLFQALLLVVGADELRALAWVGLAGSLLAALALYRWGGSFAVAGFLFAGGLAGFRYLKTGVLIDFQAFFAWKSLPLAMYVTQRPFLFALPAGLLLMAHWREKFFAAPPSADAPAEPVPWRGRGLIPFWVECLLYGVMPAFHVFAFMFLSALLGWWFVAYIARTRMRWHLLSLVGVVLLPATGLVYLMTDHFRAGSNIKRQLGWMIDDKGLTHLWLTRHVPWLGFWIDNFGLFALLGPVLWCLCAYWAARAVVLWRDAAAATPAANRRRTAPVIERPREAAAAFVLPAGIVFVATCVWLFAPWAWDNTKLMIWCYLAALPFVWEIFVRPCPVLLRVPVCALLFFSGAVTLAGGLGKPEPNWSLLETAELNSVREIVRELPAGARIAACPDYNHPLVYCGRNLGMGYAGHLRSQGLDYESIQRDLDAVLDGGPDWEQAAQRLGVRYVFWGPREVNRYPSSTLPWANPDEPVARGDYGTVYEIRPTAAAR